MTGFINPHSNIFPNLSDSREPVLSAEVGTYAIGVKIVNTTDQIIFVSLKLVKLLDIETPQEVFWAFKKEIAPRQEMDLISCPWQYLEDGDSLIVFSEGYTQVFDCTVFYAELNELNQ